MSSNIRETREEVSRLTSALQLANREVATLSFGILGIFRKLGLPPQLDALLQKLQMIVATAKMAELAVTRAYAAAGPIGWGMAAISFAGAALTGADLVMELDSH